MADEPESPAADEVEQPYEATSVGPLVGAAAVLLLVFVAASAPKRKLLTTEPAK